MSIGSIILCAGNSSRMNSKTTKILHNLAGKPLAYWSIKNALACTDLAPIVVLNKNNADAEKILQSYFTKPLIFVYQNQALGTGDAVKTALPHLPKNCAQVLLLYGDTPLLEAKSINKLIGIQKDSLSKLALLTSIVKNPTGYGRIIKNQNNQLVAIVEEAAANAEQKKITEVNTGTYIFDHEFLRENLKKITNNNPKKEYCITDLVEVHNQSAEKNSFIAHGQISEKEMQGVNDRNQLSLAYKNLNQRILNSWMAKGVSIIDPSSTYIDDEVNIAQDVTIYPNAHLRGQCSIEEDVTIEQGSIIKDSIIKKHSHILPYSFIEGAQISEHCQIGPFARLRPGTILQAKVKVGNFVELKNSLLKEEAKASHLSYVGDSEIGKKTNIGAGSITCNFDGQNKHKTIIGDECFVGSNTTLVAPINIGEKTYIAAGSTLTDDVPKNTLAIARQRQVHKNKKA